MSRPPSRGCVGIYRRLSRLFVYYSDVGRSSIIYGKIVGRTNRHGRIPLLVVCREIEYWITGVLAYSHMILSWGHVE